MKGRKEAVRPPFGDGGFFVLRSPLLPLDCFYQWGEDLERKADEEALARDAAVVRARLRALVDRPEIREALFVASPGVEESLVHWMRDPDGERGQKVERTPGQVRRAHGQALDARSACSPAARSAGSPTRPRRWSAARQLPAPHPARQRLPRALLLARWLADPAVRDGLRYAPTPASTRPPGACATPRRGSAGKRTRSYHLVAVEPTEYLDARCSSAPPAARGPASWPRHLVAADPEIAVDEARGFVDELIDSQLLVPDLAPAVTGPEPIDDLLAQLVRCRRHAPVASVLERAARRDRRPRRRRPSATSRPIATARSPTSSASCRPRSSCRACSRSTWSSRRPSWPCRARWSPTIARGVGAPGAQRRRRRRVDRSDGRFREAFEPALRGPRGAARARCSTRRRGIGFGRATTPGAEAAPLLAGIPFGARRRPTAAAPVGAAHAHLRRAVERRDRPRRREIVLGDDDLTALETEVAGAAARRVPDAWCGSAPPRPRRWRSGDCPDLPRLLLAARRAA